jgi:hypothetical protein
MSYTEDVRFLDGLLETYFAQHRHRHAINRADIAGQQQVFQRLYALAAQADHAQAAYEAEQAQLSQVGTEPTGTEPAGTAAPCAGCDESKQAKGGRARATNAANARWKGRTITTPKGKFNDFTGGNGGSPEDEQSGTERRGADLAPGQTDGDGPAQP